MVVVMMKTMDDNDDMVTMVYNKSLLAITKIYLFLSNCKRR